MKFLSGPILEILRKEFRQALRDPRMRALLIAPPLIQLIVFGYAVNLDVQNAAMAWMDRDRTPESRALLAGFEGSGRFSLRATPDREEEIRQLLDRGDVQILIRVPPGFAQDLHRGNPAAVQILIEGTNSNTAAILSSYANRIVARYMHGILAERQRTFLAGAGSSSDASVPLRIPTVETEARAWFNSNFTSRYYFVPGVVVNIIALVTVMLTAMAIVREKELGTMEQLMVTPIRPVELILGKLLPFSIVGLAEVALVTSAALIVFRIPFRGNALLLFGCAVLFLLTTLGVGLFISTISNTQQQAMMTSFFFFLPTFMLSGFAFPIRNMPEAVQYLTYLNPLRYYLEITRGIFLKGTGVSILWPQMLALLLFGLTVLSLSALRFRKRLD